MRDIDVFIDTDEIAEFFYEELIRRGFIPAEEEVRELADITFDYLVKKEIIAEEWED
ncbi:YozD family protein [Siminovitchia sediminis]|uniref:YozD family protein n=1 Tax=Siminovitchia sediminis TaxID=1274353 RepID=A0ABW4KG77_9BACI